jgi:PTH1 family peptidyl-tRNA hydrolase
VGYRTIQQLAERLEVRLKKPHFKRFLIGKAAVSDTFLYLVKPLTFMNASGEAVLQALRYAGGTVEDLVVVCDSLDLPTGICRLKRRGSSSGQKGLESVIKALGTQEFMRLRIGIGRPERKDHVVAYVLGVPPQEEQRSLGEAERRAADALLQLVRETPEKVMNVLNQSPL